MEPLRLNDHQVSALYGLVNEEDTGDVVITEQDQLDTIYVEYAYGPIGELFQVKINTIGEITPQEGAHVARRRAAEQ